MIIEKIKDNAGKMLSLCQLEHLVQCNNKVFQGKCN